MSLVIFVLGVIYFVAHFLAFFFRKTKVPDVLILMIMGILAGPVFNIIEPGDFGHVGQVMVTIALILILFESGTNLDIKVLATCFGPMLLISLATFILTVAVIAGIAIYLLGFPVLTGLLAGAIMGGTSSAVVIPMVKELGMAGKPSTILVIESAVTDVLCIVIAISLMEASVSNELSTGGILQDILLESLLLSSLIGIATGYIWLVLLNLVRMFPNNLYTTFAYVFLVYGFTEFLGFSGAIASLALGITLANNRRSGFRFMKAVKVVGLAVVTDTERLVFSEMVFLLKTFFFLYLGVSLTFRDTRSLFLVLLILLLVYAGRLVITRFMISKKTSWKDAAYMSVMIPKGLAAAILASMPVAAGIDGGETIQSMAYYIVLGSITLTALMVPMVTGLKPVNGFYKAFFKRFATDEQIAESPDSELIPSPISELPGEAEKES